MVAPTLNAAAARTILRGKRIIPFVISLPLGSLFQFRLIRRAGGDRAWPCHAFLPASLEDLCITFEGFDEGAEREVRAVETDRRPGLDADVPVGPPHRGHAMGLRPGARGVLPRH